MAIWRIRIACWIPKPINTHTHTHTHTQSMEYEGWNFNSGNYLFTTDTK